jgi:hypothetical protein
MPSTEQREFLARLAREAASSQSLPTTWRRDGGWLLAPAGPPYVSLGFAVRRRDAGAYVHIVRNTRTERLIARLEAERFLIERAFGGRLTWGAPRGRQRYQIYYTVDRARYAEPVRRWTGSIAVLIRTLSASRQTRSPWPTPITLTPRSSSSPTSRSTRLAEALSRAGERSTSSGRGSRGPSACARSRTPTT